MTQAARRLQRAHLVLTFAWGLLIIPTVAWWADSILWVGLMSIYACMVGHWSAYQAARTER